MAWLKKADLQKKEPVEEIEEEKPQLRPQSIRKVPDISPKGYNIKTIVVKELPVQIVRTTTDKNIVRQYSEDGENISEIRFVTIEEALTEVING